MHSRSGSPPVPRTPQKISFFFARLSCLVSSFGFVFDLLGSSALILAVILHSSFWFASRQTTLLVHSRGHFGSGLGKIYTLTLTLTDYIC